MTTDEVLKLSKKLVAKWQHIATSYCWRVDVFYHGRARDMPNNASDALGFSHGRYPYMQGGVHLNLDIMSAHDLDEDEIEEVVVHEFCHFLLFPMQSGGFSDKDTELCVTMIARTLLDMQCPNPKTHKKK